MYYEVADSKIESGLAGSDRLNFRLSYTMKSDLTGLRFTPEVITGVLGCYLRYGAADRTLHRC